MSLHLCGSPDLQDGVEYGEKMGVEYGEKSASERTSKAPIAENSSQMAGLVPRFLALYWVEYREKSGPNRK